MVKSHEKTAPPRNHVLHGYRVAKALGFSLIELLVTLAIAGILATVAYPSYQDSVRKTRRTDGITALLSLQVSQERLRGNCPVYAQNIGPADICGINAGTSVVRAANSSSDGYYSLSMAPGSVTASSYTILATPQKAQISDTGCAPLSVTFSPETPNGFKEPAGCW